MILNDLKMNVIDMLNESNLPIDAIYYVMKEIMDEVITAYNKILEEENKNIQQNKEEKKDETEQ